jgi:uncharacterized protein (DUF697 family)
MLRKVVIGIVGGAIRATCPAGYDHAYACTAFGVLKIMNMQRADTYKQKAPHSGAFWTAVRSGQKLRTTTITGEIQSL